MDVNPSDDWLDFLRGWEALRLRAYLDGAGVPTIGYGHTTGVRMGQTCTEDQAEQWLVEEASHALSCVNHCVAVDLEQYEAETLGDFVWNLGSGAFANSTLLRQLNLGRREVVPAELMRWINIRVQNPDGTSTLVKSDGLEKRANARIAMWLDGDYSLRP